MTEQLADVPENRLRNVPLFITSPNLPSIHLNVDIKLHKRAPCPQTGGQSAAVAAEVRWSAGAQSLPLRPDSAWERVLQAASAADVRSTATLKARLSSSLGSPHAHVVS